jgi:hypothetical protein
MSDVRLGGGFPDADDDIVRFVLEDMSDETRFLATSSPVIADSPSNVSPSAKMPSLSKPSASSPPPTTPVDMPEVDQQPSATGASGKPKLAVATHQAATSSQRAEETKAEGKGAEAKQVQDERAKTSLAEANLRATLAWNHAMAVALLQASFEKCMLITNERNRPTLTYSSFEVG